MKRYLIEYETDDFGTVRYQIVENNDPDPVYIMGVDSGFVGLTLSELREAITTDPDYSELDRKRLLKEVEALEAKEQK